jgi:hypothetical protein
VVHDAFCGLCRRWSKLTDPARAAAYLRAAVLNGCRDAPLLAREDRLAVLSAPRRLPGRQREVLVLRYYLELPDAEVSRVMGIGESSVRSAAHRGLAALARLLANGADVLCGGYTIPAGWSIEAKGFPKGQVTQGFGEFSVTTGRLVAILGQVRAPISLAASPANPYQQETSAGNFPFLLWASADAQVTIGLTDGGHAVLVRDGRTRRLPWPLSIAIPYDSAAPGAAW